jgi:predicted amidohydrolase YtcJ
MFVQAALLLITAGSGQAKKLAVICGGQRDLALVKGDIHTMMAEPAVTDAVLIRDGRIAAVGAIGDPGPCTDVIDLKGRTVIPGLIDNHVHFIRLGNLAGHHLRSLERAFTVKAALDQIRTRAAELPAGALMSLIGGIEPTQFAEGRFPTLQELDGVAPRNPVYLSADGFGPGQTNSAGRDHLRQLGVTVSDEGVVALNADTAKAFDQLAARMTNAERRQALLEEQAFALSVGLTTLMDQSGSVPGVGYLDQATGYDAFLDILRSDELKVRLRLFFPALDEAGDKNRQLLRQLDTRWRDYGPDLAKIVGIGEWSVGMDEFAKPVVHPETETAILTIARRGWPYRQHVISADEIDRHLDIFEKVAAAGHKLGEMGWSLDHLNGITRKQVERANALGIGLALHPWPYLPSRELTGPPLRLVLDTAKVPLGGGSDGARISTLNPWSMIYYMVTGRNHAGKLVNPGQQITREEAIRLWTGPDQGYFSHEMGQLGGIAAGRFGDLVVLDRNIFDEKAVSDDDIRIIASALTIVNGKIVYDAGAIAGTR